MRLTRTVIGVLLCVAMLSSLLSQVGETATAGPGFNAVSRQLDSTPLAFTKNEGQWDERVLYRSSIGASALWICWDGVFLQTTEQTEPGGLEEQGDRISPSNGIKGLAVTSTGGARTRIDRIIIPATDSMTVVADRPMRHRSNYFYGREPSGWITDVPSFELVSIRDVVPGVDLWIGSVEGSLSVSWRPRPGFESAPVRRQFETAVLAAGLRLESLCSDPVIQKFVRPPLPGHNHGQGSIPTGKEIDRTPGDVRGKIESSPDATLSIAIGFSTYLGGTDSEWGTGVAVDGDGDAWVAGYTVSTDFPTANPYQGTNDGGADVFISKFDGSDNSLVFSTYLGGGNADMCRAIAIDVDGNVYVTGMTHSIDFPIVSAWQGVKASSSDAFVAKLDASGSVLVYSTYLGGTGDDDGIGVAVDANGQACVTGRAFSGDFPTANPWQGTHSGVIYDVFVTKLSASGNTAVFSTFLGGNSNENGRGIAADDDGNIYVTGFTASSDFPTVSAYDATLSGGVDAFVAKLSASGAVQYCTYLGGTAGDHGSQIAVGADRSVFVKGLTESTDFPTLNGFQSAFGGGPTDAYITKLNPSGSAIVFSTYLGGSDRDDDWSDFWGGIALDQAGNVYASGKTASSDFPTMDPVQGTYGGGVYDAFISILGASGSALVFSTYLGGSDNDVCQGIAVDPSGRAHVVGTTRSSNFPTVIPLQGAKAGIYDAFVTKLEVPVPASVQIVPAASGTQNVGQLGSFTAEVTGGTPLSYQWAVSGEVLKDYSETTRRLGTDVDWLGELTTTQMTPGDFQTPSIAFYWKPDPSQVHPLNAGAVAREVSVTVDLAEGGSVQANAMIMVERNSSDIERQAEDFYLSNHGELVRLEHREWHRQFDWRDEEYDGKLFFDFHQRFILSFDLWRKEFGYPPIEPWDPATPYPTGPEIDHLGRDPWTARPKPTWFTIAGSSATRGLSGVPCDLLGEGAGTETKLADFEDRNHLGCVVTSPWHNQVHGLVSGDMGSTALAPKDPIFWRWHRFLNQINVDWNTLPPPGHQITINVESYVVTAAPEIIYQSPFRLFKEQVQSMDTVSILFQTEVLGVTPGILTVNGQPATVVLGTGSGPYHFTGYPSPPLGPVEVAVSGGQIVATNGRVFTGDQWSLMSLDPILDPDGDGLPSGDEVLLYHTDPNVFDTDDDGIDDGTEISQGSNPNDDPVHCDCFYPGDIDADGVINAVDVAIEIDIVFFGAPNSGDMDCHAKRSDFNNDMVTDAVDLAIMIDHVFFGGDGPVDPCAM